MKLERTYQTANYGSECVTYLDLKKASYKMKILTTILNKYFLAFIHENAKSKFQSREKDMHGFAVK